MSRRPYRDQGVLSRYYGVAFSNCLRSYGASTASCIHWIFTAYR
jgi:hypothetical protein